MMSRLLLPGAVLANENSHYFYGTPILVLILGNRE